VYSTIEQIVAYPKAWVILEGEAIEAGLEDSKAGRAIDVRDVRAKFGLSK